MSTTDYLLLTNTNISPIMAIRITTQPSADDLFGKSHWWGSPDLPEGVDYPCSDDLGADENGEEATLLFICQIRLEDIAEYDAEGRLPHKGMLYFFADIDYFLGRDDADCEGLGQWPEECFRVLYAPECDNLVTHYIIDEDGKDVSLPEEAISFAPCDDSESGFKLLGRPFYNEYEEHEGLVSLLQLDECEEWGLRFFDMGMANFLISPEALASKDFNEAIFFVHSL